MDRTSMMQTGIFRWGRTLAATMMTAALAACDGGAGNANGSEGGASYPAELDAPAPEATTEDGAALGHIVYGDADAPATLLEFASWTCGACGNFYKTVLPEVKERLVETGKLRVVMVDWPRQSFDVAVSAVARCRGPEAYPKIAELLFENQGQWVNQQANEELPKLLRQVGMSRAEYDRCMSKRDLQKTIAERGQELGDTYDIKYTPYLVLNGRELKMERGKSQVDQIAEAVDAAIGS